MANRQQQQQSSSGGGGGYSSTVSPSNLDTSKLGGGGGFGPPPPPLIQPNQIPSPSIKTPNLPSPANGIPIPHLSTPPGPPVFSSPLQPAAVPFRTSPATPQPIAPYSSNSSLPTSSPPPLNGSHHQTSDLTEELAFAPHADSPNLLFSAHKVLKQKKLANVPSLGFGAIVSPGREVSQGPQIIQRDPHRCQNCGAYANLYCNILLGSGQWQCVICRNLNGSEGEYIAPSKEELRNLLPELSSPLVDYIQTPTRRPGYVPVSESRISAPVVLVIDECLDEQHVQHLQSSLHAFVDSLPPTTKLGIVLYGRMVSVYDFSEESVASADVLPGDKSPSEDALRALIYGTGVYLSTVHASLSVAHAILSSLTPYKLNLPEVQRDRCLGAAVEVALAIIQGPSAEMSRGVIKRPGGNSRIIVCAGGPCTYGPGSVPHSLNHPNYLHLQKSALKWMDNLGSEAHRRNTVVDILCAGTCPVRVPLLQPLTKSSGGVLILHDDFGEAFGVNLQRASSRAAGSHGLLEIRCSDSIFVSQVVGPGEEAHVDTHESFKNDSAIAIQMLSVEETQSFSVSMENRADIKSNFVHFQFAIQYSNVYQADISRVITVRLPTVDSVSAYLESIQDEVAAVLIGKRTLLRAKSFNDALDMRLTLDERIKDVAIKFGSQVPKSKLHRYPKELSLLPEILFHLRRGPLLGSILGHEDERSVLRSLFLNASFDLSLRMLAPRCLMHREGGTFEELPAYDLAMQSDAAVVLDHGTDVFIWLGAELAAQEAKSAAALAACRTLAEELTELRFPAPRILAFKEGSSQARYFVSRLIPAHKDPSYEQTVSKRNQLMTLLSRSKMAGISVLRSAGFIHHAAAAAVQVPVSISLSTRTFRNGPSKFSVFAQSQDFSTRLQDSMQSLPKLLEDIVQTSINTGPRGALRLAQGIQAVIGVGTEWVADASKAANSSSGLATDLQLGLLSPLYLRKLFERLGATYIKLGQFIASAPTLFPPEYVQEFQYCFDRAPTIPFQEIQAILRQELGRPIDTVFEFVDPTPIASASIAQVHGARIRGTQEDVVIKVLKPGIEDVLVADLNFVYIVARILEFLSPDLSRASLVAIVKDIRESMLEEVDFKKEATNVESFRRYLESMGLTRQATAPKVYKEYSTKRILTMERLYGVPLTDLNSINSLVPNPETSLITALNVWFGSLLACDTFHADVHAGNLWLLRDGRIGFLDFGIVGRISPKTWGAMEVFLASLPTGEYESMASSLIDMGATSKTVDSKAFARDLERIFSSIQDLDTEIIIATAREANTNATAVSANVVVDERQMNALFLDLVRVSESYGLRFPREFALLMKQLLYFDRYTRLLAPNLNMLRDQRINIVSTQTSRVS